MPTEKYIAFFDLDHTLLRGNSGRLLLNAARREKIIRLTDILKALWLSFLFRFDLMETEKIIHGMVKWLKGVPETELENLIKRAFENKSSVLISESAKTVIQLHRNSKARLVILSSALFPVCRIVADILNFDDIICTELVSVDGILSGNTQGKLCFGDEKKIRLLKYCEINNSNKLDAWFYTDSITDLPALESVGHAMCVNPDRKLRKKAGEKGWQILEW